MAALTIEQKRILRRTFLVIAALGATALPARGPSAAQGSGPRIGLVFDVGGRGDKSFNDAAYAGLLAAAASMGIRSELAEPAGSEDREAALRLFAARGFDLVIGVGYIFTRDIDEVARAFPSVKFACIDYSGDPATIPRNVAGLRFREEEGSFLVGAAAGLETRTGHVGFVGGMNIPLIKKFEAGYRAGLESTCPGCTLHVAYAGTTPDAFRDPAKGKAIASSQIAARVDLLYHASGLTGGGVFEAAKTAGARAIGVDRDQYDEAPGFILTSMVKRVDTAVVEVIRSVVENRFQGGTQDLGLADRGVDWVHEGPHAAGLSPRTIPAVEALRARIIAGEIRVPRSP
jgi:basic membrane protein A